MATAQDKAVRTVRTLLDERLGAGEGKVHGALGVCPLLTGGDSEISYLIYEEALEAGTASVREIGDAGSVPELLFTNSGDMAVLVIDGEQLVGAKQNRVLNTTVLVPAGSEVIIPVSCVEQGRWHFETSREMRSAPVNLYAGSRARKARRVSANLETRSSYDGGQREVWDDMRQIISRDRSHAPTGAMSDHFRQQAGRLQEFHDVLSLESFAKVDGKVMVGAVFTLEGKLMGMDAFDKSSTLAKQWPKLLNSYAMEALGRKRPGRVDRSACEDFMSRAGKSDMTAFKPPGAGIDVRMNAPGIAGSALVAEGSAVHMYAFDINGSGEDSVSPGNRTTMASFEQRLRHRGSQGRLNVD